MYHYDSNGAGTCPQCGAELYGNEVFCTQCGASLGDGTQGASETPRIGRCPNPYCQRPIYAGDVYCTYCGQDLQGGVGPQPSGPDAVTPKRGNGPTVLVDSSTPPFGEAIDHTVPVNGSSGSGVTFAKPLEWTDDDCITARPQMVRLTREEARMGCRKTVEVDGRFIKVDIPAGVGLYTKLDVPNLGYYDEATGERGPLRLSFRIV